MAAFEFLDRGSIEVARRSCFCSLDNANNRLISNTSAAVFFAGKRDQLRMKAIIIEGGGGPEVLKLKEVDDPIAGEGEVLIKVAAAALNRADVMQRSGHYPPPPGASLIPGLECSGTIEAVGHGVTQWKVGDEVQNLVC